MPNHIMRLVRSEGAVRTGERPLCSVDSQVPPNIRSGCTAVVANLTLESVSLSVRVETLDRSQRQLTERALRRLTAAVSGTCIRHWWAQIWRENRKSLFHMIAI